VTKIKCCKVPVSRNRAGETPVRRLNLYPGVKRELMGTGERLAVL